VKAEMKHSTALFLDPDFLEDSPHGRDDSLKAGQMSEDFFASVVAI
jgi:hypothetical protein